MKTYESQQLVEKIFRFNKVLHKQMGLLTECSPGEFKMLGVIFTELKELESNQCSDPGVTVSKLSKCLMHSKPATSKMLNTLEEKELIKRITTKADRRAVYITLTEEGREKVTRIHNRLDDYTNKMLEHLGEEDTKKLLYLLDRMYDIADGEGEKIISEIETLHE